MNWSFSFLISGNATIRPFIFYWGAIYWIIVKHWRRKTLRSKEIIEKLFPILIFLSLHPFVLEEAVSSLSQDFHCLCELSIVSRIEVVEAQVKGLNFSVSREVVICIFVYINRNICLSSITCVILNICIHGCN